MKAWLFMLLLIIPLAVAFDYQVGETKEVYFYCVNASDGRPLGTTASLKVRNDTGVYYQVASLHNEEIGVFKHNITNLTRDHCYSFLLNCTTAGSFNIEWGTVCTETNVTSSGVSNFASVGGLVFSSGLFLYLSQYFLHIPILTLSMIMLSEVFLAGALYFGLKWAEAVQAGLAVLGIMNFIFYMFVIILSLSLVGFFWYAVVSTIVPLFKVQAKGLKRRTLK